MSTLTKGNRNFNQTILWPAAVSRLIRFVRSAEFLSMDLVSDARHDCNVDDVHRAEPDVRFVLPDAARLCDRLRRHLLDDFLAEAPSAARVDGNWFHHRRLNVRWLERHDGQQQHGREPNGRADRRFFDHFGAGDHRLSDGVRGEVRGGLGHSGTAGCWLGRLLRLLRAVGAAGADVLHHRSIEVHQQPARRDGRRDRRVLHDQEQQLAARPHLWHHRLHRLLQLRRHLRDEGNFRHNSNGPGLGPNDGHLGGVVAHRLAVVPLPASRRVRQPDLRHVRVQQHHRHGADTRDRQETLPLWSRRRPPRADHQPTGRRLNL